MPSKEPPHSSSCGGRRGTLFPSASAASARCLAATFTLSAGVSALKQLDQAQTRYEAAAAAYPGDADNGEPINYPKEWASTVTIAADAPLGTTTWRVTCGWGGTRPRPFIVGDLPEFIETEPNSDPDRAERVTLPVTINGQISGERDVDFFVFHAEKDAVVVCDLLAGRIGSPLDPVLGVRDPQGRRVLFKKFASAPTRYWRFADACRRLQDEHRQRQLPRRAGVRVPHDHLNGSVLRLRVSDRKRSRDRSIRSNGRRRLPNVDEKDSVRPLRRLAQRFRIDRSRQSHRRDRDAGNYS